VVVEEAELRVQTRNRRLADAMTSARESSAALEALEVETNAMKADWEQACVSRALGSSLYLSPSVALVVLVILSSSWQFTL